MWKIWAVLIILAAIAKPSSCLENNTEDIPGPPRNVYTTSIDWNLLLHWTGSNSTVGLPVAYSVYIQCLNISQNNCIKWSNIHKPFEPMNVCNLVHQKGNVYSCNLRAADLDAQYNATIYASNSRGNSSAWILFRRPTRDDPSQTTPSAPSNLVATEIEPGVVRLSWKKKDSWAFKTDMLYFKIISMKYGGSENKTKPISGKYSTAQIRDLQADTMYTFYAMAQFRNSERASTFGAPAIANLHTVETAPDQPPQDLQCNASASDADGQREITLSWEPPDKEHQNGRLTHYLVILQNFGSSANNRSIRLPPTSNHYTLQQKINKDKTINLQMRACNQKGCSGIGQSPCIIPGVGKGQLFSQLSNTTVIILACVLAVTLAGALIIIIVWHIKKHKVIEDDEDDIDGVVGDLGFGYAGHYDDVLENQDSKEYQMGIDTDGSALLEISA